MESLGINASKIVHPPNPFYPLNTEVVGYLANEWSVPILLGIFAAGWVVILGATNMMVKRHNPTLAATEKAAILWFVLCKCTPSLDISGEGLLTLLASRHNTFILRRYGVTISAAQLHEVDET